MDWRWQRPSQRSGELPPLHETLTHSTLPRVELHWRAHWYEDRFAADALQRAERPDAGAPLRMLPGGRARDAHAHLRPRRAVGPEDSCGHRGLVGYEMRRRGSRCPDRLDRPRLPGARSTGARGHSRARPPWGASNPLAVSAAVSLDGSRRARDPVLRGRGCPGPSQCQPRRSAARARPRQQSFAAPRAAKVHKDLQRPLTRDDEFAVHRARWEHGLRLLRRWGLAVAPAAVRACRPRPNRTPGSAAKDHDAIPTPDDKSREDIGRAAEDVTADALISFDGVWQLGRHRGPQRAGKTTLLRIATGILAPDADTVTIDGLHSHRNWREYHRRLGFCRPGIGVCMHGSACEAT